MPRALSAAMCSFVKTDLESGIMDIKTLMSRHRISDKKARTMKQLFLATGEVHTLVKKKGTGRKRKITTEMEESLRHFLDEHPHSFLKDMCKFMDDTYGIQLTESTMQRTCGRIGWKLKKQPRPRDELGFWRRTLPRDEDGNAIRGVRQAKKKTYDYGKKLSYVAKKALLVKTREWVQEYMSQPQFDASHDYNHIQRVLALSLEILRVEQNHFRKIAFDGLAVELVALLHDIDDHKYRPTAANGNVDGYPTPPTTMTDPQQMDPHNSSTMTNPHQINGHNVGASALSNPQPQHSQSSAPSNSHPHPHSHFYPQGESHIHHNIDPNLPDPQTPPLLEDEPSPTLEDHLLRLGWPPYITSKVAAIVPFVSYTAETTDPAGFASALALYPELAIVQDADRLDAIGASGIGRAFTYGGAKSREGGMAATMDHFGTKLIELEARMKTGEGRRMAVARAERLRIFGRWWQEEMRMVGAETGGMEWVKGVSPWVGTLAVGVDCNVRHEGEGTGPGPSVAPPPPPLPPPGLDPRIEADQRLAEAVRLAASAEEANNRDGTTAERESNDQPRERPAEVESPSGESDADDEDQDEDMQDDGPQPSESDDPGRQLMEAIAAAT